MKSFKIITLPGDGIGPEITKSALSILNAVSESYNVEFNIIDKPVGGCSIDEFGVPLTDDTLNACLSSDAVFLGAVGGPKWESISHDKKPEQALLSLRKELGLFSNLRPAKVFNSLLDSSTLKPNIIKDTDIMIVRELTGGIYFGRPRGMNKSRAWNTLEYSRQEIERIAHVAFKLAGKRSGNLVSVHKSNVLESSQFWQNVVHDVHLDYPEIQLSDMYVDNAAMQIVQDPRQFDVIVTQNLFGDILSDISAMITGSLGMLPSASVGDKYSLYEPVHGSAPDLAGKNQANPIAAILSIAMMHDITFDMKKASSCIYEAINSTLVEGYSTADIATNSSTVVSTSEMTDLIKENVKRLLVKID